MNRNSPHIDDRRVMKSPPTETRSLGEKSDSFYLVGGGGGTSPSPRTLGGGGRVNTADQSNLYAPFKELADSIRSSATDQRASGIIIGGSSLVSGASASGSATMQESVINKDTGRIDNAIMLQRINMNNMIKYDGLTQTLGILITIIKQQNEDIQVLEKKVRESELKRMAENTEGQANLGKMVEELANRVDKIKEEQQVVNTDLYDRVNEAASALQSSASYVKEAEEMQQKTATDLRYMRDAIDNKASTSDLLKLQGDVDRCLSVNDFVSFKMELKADSDMYARTSDYLEVKDALIAFASKEDFNNLKRYTDKKLQGKSEELNDTLRNFFTRSDADKLEKVVGSKFEKFSQDVNAKFATTNDILDTLSGTSAQIKESLEGKASFVELEGVRNKLKDFVLTVDMDAYKKQTASKITTVTENLDKIMRTLQVHANEIDQHDRKITTKASKLDIAQLQGKLQDSCATKSEMVASLRPIVTKVDQVVAKVIELEKATEDKCTMDTLYRTQEKLEDLIQAMKTQLMSSAPEGGFTAYSSVPIASSDSPPISYRNPQNREGSETASPSRRNRRLARRQSLKDSPGGGGGGGDDDDEKGGVELGVKAESKLTDQLQAMTEKQFQALKEQIDFIHQSLSEIRLIIEGKKGGGKAEQHPNHHLWQQMIAFRKILILTGGKDIENSFGGDGGFENATEEDEGMDGGGGTNESPRTRNIVKQSSALSKKRWELEEKQRWLVDTRTNRTISNGGGQLTVDGTGGGLPDIDKK